MVDPRDVARLISENPDEMAQSPTTSGAHFYDVNTLRSNYDDNTQRSNRGNPDEVAQGNPDEKAQGMTPPNSRGFDLVDFYSNYHDEDEQGKEELRQKLGQVIDRLTIYGAENFEYADNLPSIYDVIHWLNDHPQGRVEIQADKHPLSSTGDAAYTLYSRNFDDIDYDQDDDPLGMSDGTPVTEKSKDRETGEYYFHFYNHG